MIRNTISAAVWVMLAVLTAIATAQQAPVPATHNDVVIRNAVVMTVTHGNIPNGSVYTTAGKVVVFGANASAPASATAIGAGGKYLTPGTIDSHSPLALDNDVNE